MQVTCTKRGFPLVVRDHERYTSKNAQVANKLLQICSQAVDKLCSHCLSYIVAVTSLEQAVNNL
jgi:hypothetical protein